MYPRFSELRWITPYGIALASACILCFWLTRRRARAAGWDVSHIDLALPLALVCGAFGVKLAAFLFFDRLLLFVLPLGALPALWIYCRRTGLSVLKLGDLLAPPLLLWLAVLRIGCFFAGCCWGDVVMGGSVLQESERLQISTIPPVNALLAFTALAFPAGSPAAHQHAALGLIASPLSPSLPVLPTQLYESIALVGLYFLLALLERMPRRDGIIVSATLGAYAILRFSLEFLRADNALLVGPLTGNQGVCIALIGFSLWLLRSSSRAA